MNFGNNVGEERIELHMAPLLDCIFLLLLFFVSTSVFTQMEAELGITLPTASEAQHMTRAAGEIIINVHEDGTIVVNQQELTIAQLTDVLQRVSELFKGQAVIVRGHRHTELERIVDVLNACAQADIWNVSIAALRPEEKV